ncbi:hypothetical protein [Ralstonia solanacearum]|uniref:Uncharacterized protein n=1 Tax=Ralstonia solanacearum TaxID=305 RepID=A0AAE3T6B2_RALSL|nr:hypothetical protein [Ralstonia solanacearum]MBB6581637.1 hypothetical protein [Ralstonia solanacearum]MDB0523783.1 hypothetical protein [Ralstonia solanacearum]
MTTRTSLTSCEPGTLSLIQQAQAIEQERHRRRMAEIDTMAAAMRGLHGELPGIEAVGGLLLGERFFSLGGSRLAYSCETRANELRLCTALLRTGWEILHRGTVSAYYPSPTFVKGALSLTVSCIEPGTLETAEQNIRDGSEAVS